MRRPARPRLQPLRRRSPLSAPASWPICASAARDVGFFYLAGHGISARADRRGAVGAARRFFALPGADKLAIEMVNSPHFRGYNASRPGADPRPARLARAGRHRRRAEGAAVRRRRCRPGRGCKGPNQWPARAARNCSPVAARWQARADSGRDPAAAAPSPWRSSRTRTSSSRSTARPPNQLIKIIRYPGREATESDQGVGAHKDSGFLTLLLQERQRGCRSRPTTAAGSMPSRAPGTFVVNIGEMLGAGLQRLSARHGASRGHAAGRHATGCRSPSSSARNSTPMCRCSTCRRSCKAEARGVTRDPHNPLFRKVGQNALKSRLRSHPDVAQRHHADLARDQRQGPRRSRSCLSA